jgi:hypothetical protein
LLTPFLSQPLAAYDLHVAAEEDVRGRLLPTAKPHTALLAETAGKCLFISRVAFHGVAQHRDLSQRLSRAGFFTCPDSRVFSAYLKVQDWERFRDTVFRDAQPLTVKGGEPAQRRRRCRNLMETTSPMPLRDSLV